MESPDWVDDLERFWSTLAESLAVGPMSRGMSDDRVAEAAGRIDDRQLWGSERALFLQASRYLDVLRQCRPPDAQTPTDEKYLRALRYLATGRIPWRCAATGTDEDPR